MSSRKSPDHVRNAAVEDYKTSGDPYAVVAARHGISKSRLNALVRGPGAKRKPKTWGADEIGRTGGHWTPSRHGIQVWQPCFFNSPQTCNINHQENRNAA